MEMIGVATRPDSHSELVLNIAQECFSLIFRKEIVPLPFSSSTEQQTMIGDQKFHDDGEHDDDDKRKLNPFPSLERVHQITFFSMMGGD